MSSETLSSFCPQIDSYISMFAVYLQFTSCRILGHILHGQGIQR